MTKECSLFSTERFLLATLESSALKPLATAPKRGAKERKGARSKAGLKRKQRGNRWNNKLGGLHVTVLSTTGSSSSKYHGKSKLRSSTLFDTVE